MWYDTPIDTKVLTPPAKKYDQNWFVRFQKEAHYEDIASGMGVGDPMRSDIWVNIAVSFLAKNLSRAPFEIMKGDSIVETGPVARLFDFVNPVLSKYQLWEATQGWRKIAGEAFWVFDFYDRAESGEFPTSIYIPNPSSMTHKVDKDTGEISMWVFEEGQTKIPFLPGEVIHFRTWNKWDRYRGVNELIAAGYELAQSHEADVANLGMLRANATPNGILVPPDYISVEQATEIKERWNQAHQGARKRHAIAVLGNGVKYQQTQMTTADMEFFQMKKWSRQAVLAKYGIPGVLVGVTDDRAPLSGSDTKFMMRAVWNNTLMPDIMFYEDKLKTDFFDRFKLDFEGKFNVDVLPELQEDEADLVERGLKEVGANVLTINEYRELVGRDPVPWGDTAYFPMAMVPWNAAPEPKVEPPKMLAEIIQPKAIPQYSDIFKEFHWKAVIKYWEKIEREYQKDFQEWLFNQRSYLLDVLSQKIDSDTLSQLMEEGYWREQEEVLKELSMAHFFTATVATEGNLKNLFKDVGIPFDFRNWSIFNTGAVSRIDTRITKIGGVVDTVRNHLGDSLQTAVEDGLSVKDTADLIRDKYNNFKHHAETVARTELGGVIGDARIEGFKSVGIDKHEWSSSRDGNVRIPGVPKGNIYDHTLDGVIVAIGEPFPTNGGLLWPNDIGGAAGDVINCRCLTLPVRSE